MAQDIDGVKIAIKKGAPKKRTVRRKKVSSESSASSRPSLKSKAREEEVVEEVEMSHDASEAKSPKSSKKQKGSPLATFIAILVTALIVGGAIYTWQRNQADQSISEVESEKETIKSGLERELGNLKNKILGIETENEELKTAKEELEEKAKLLEGAKLEYKDNELGFSFEYPAKLGQAHVVIENGATGKIFSGSFEDYNELRFGGISADYTSSSTPSFLATRGFVKKSNNYFIRESGEGLNYQIEPIVISGQDADEKIIIDKNSFIGVAESTDISLRESDLGALINFSNDAFEGVAFLNMNKDVIGVDEFRKIIDSFE